MSFRIDQLAVLNLATVGNSVTAGSFVKSGGTSSQFLKADGSVDSNTYLTSGSFLPLSGGTMTGKIFTVSSGTGTYEGAFEIRETGYASDGQSAWGYSPAISFHWGNRYAKRFGMRFDGLFAIDDEPLALRSWVTSQGYITSSTLSSTLSNYIYTNSGNFTTAGTGWYRVATTGSDGRGTYYVEVYTTGGNHNPSYLKILAHGDWGNDKIVSVETDGGFPANAVRITRGASNTFLEVNFTTQILGASLRVNRTGFDSAIQIYTGALPAGGDTVWDSVSVYSKGYHTPGAVFAKTRMLVGSTDDNSGKADLSVDTAGSATIALAGQYFRVGSDDVNWGVRIQHNGYFRTYGQPLGLTTSAGNYDISFQPNDTQVAYFNTNGLYLSRPLIRTAAGTGYLSGNYGSSESTATSGVIYTIGGSYVPNANNLGNMYGIGYTYGAIAGLGANSAWGLYVATNGTTRVFLDADSGIGTATGSWRAPIFYDSADTNYYLDPNSSSVLNQITTNGRIYSNEWIQFSNYTGLYSPNNGAHLRPNSGSYGPWLVSGNKNGWSGIEFESLSNGNVNLMVSTSSNVSGFHNNSYGWQMKWEGGSLYVFKNTYGGGTGATVLDSSNYTSYSPSLTGSGASGTWGINVTGSAGSVAWVNVSGRPSALSSFTNDIVARTTLNASGDFQFGGQDLAQNNFGLSSATTDTDQFGRYYYSGTSGSIWTRYLPVDKSGKYRMKIRWKASASNGTYIAVILLDTNGNNINGAGTYWAYPWSGGGAPTSWNTQEYWYDGSSFPSNAAYVAFGISHTNYGGGSATYYVSQLEIERYSDQISGNAIINAGGSYSNPSWITSLAWSKITGAPSFLTSESDTLATVTSRGASTSSAVTFNNTLTVGGGSVYTYMWNDGSGTYLEAVGNTTATRKIRIQGNNGSGSYAQWFVDAGNQQIYGEIGGYANLLFNSSTAYLRYNGSDKLWTGSDGIRVQGWTYFQNNGQGLHWPNNGWHIYPKDGSDIYVRSGSSDASIQFMRSGTAANYIHNASDNAIGFLSTSRSWILRVANDGSTQVYGQLTVGNTTSSDIYMTDTDESTRRIHTNSGRIGFLNTSNSWGAYCDNSGNWFSDHSMRAPIFYDSDDTAYYGNFASTSRMNNIMLGSTYSPSYQGQLVLGHTSYNFNFLNGSWASSVTAGILANCADEYEFAIHDSGNSVESLFIYQSSTGRILMGRDIGWGTTPIQAAADFRAPIFYDSDNTAYYLDPNSTTSIRTVGSWRSDSSSWDGEFAGKIQYHSNNWYFQYAGSALFRNSGGSNVVSIDSSGNIHTQSGGFASNAWSSSTGNDAVRVFAPQGASASWDGGITGALRIRLPQRANNTMWSMKVRIYNYSTNHTAEYTMGNYSYDQGGYNASAHFIGASSAPIYNVRFGNQDGYDCVWIGETGTSWSYPVVSVMDFQGGFRGGNAATWDDGWNITYVTSFGTIATTIYPSVRLANVYFDNLYYNGNTNYGFLSTNGYFDTVNTGASGDPLELNYHRTGNVYIGPNGGDNTVRASSFYLYNSGGQIYAINGSYIGYSTWLQSSGTHGLYSPSSGSGTHWYPAASYTYGSWYMEGFRNGYIGILLYGTAGPVTLMYDSSGNGGVYQQGDDWHYYWSEGDRCLGINGSTTSSTYALYVNGKGIYSVGDVVAYSDIRKKKDIVTIDNALGKVLDMRGVYYIRKDQEEKGRQTGVIAQEVETVLPEVVTYAKDTDEYGVAYGNMAGLFIEAFKEQQKLIQELRSEIEVLKSKI